ncbi:hypothetical protein Pelo_19648 [Pelomyxa schiedti]|nr:hypothetical protein Pelo_19648 [Pelomyxa schiedti]
MFSHVHGFCLCNEFENRNTFQAQLPTLVDSLQHLRLPLESHKWIYLFRAVVDHFNVQRSLYSAVIGPNVRCQWSLRPISMEANKSHQILMMPTTGNNLTSWLPI